MTSDTRPIDQIIYKLSTLSPERIMEVEDFIDFLSRRDAERQARQMTQLAMAASEQTLEKIWDNPDDAEYDAL